MEEIPGDAASGGDHAFAGAEAQNVTFAYETRRFWISIAETGTGKITGIHGASGSGKSTILKLLMRFWDVQTGRVSVDGADVREIPTKYLRDMESYVTAGDTSVPRFDCEQHRYCKTRRDAGRNYGGGEEGVHT